VIGQRIAPGPGTRELTQIQPHLLSLWFFVQLFPRSGNDGPCGLRCPQPCAISIRPAAAPAAGVVTS
jgi:hypothetical protein